MHSWPHHQVDLWLQVLFTTHKMTPVPLGITFFIHSDPPQVSSLITSFVFVCYLLFLNVRTRSVATLSLTDQPNAMNCDSSQMGENWALEWPGESKVRLLAPSRILLWPDYLVLLHKFSISTVSHSWSSLLITCIFPGHLNWSLFWEQDQWLQRGNRSLSCSVISFQGILLECWAYLQIHGPQWLFVGQLAVI